MNTLFYAPMTTPPREPTLNKFSRGVVVVEPATRIPTGCIAVWQVSNICRDTIRLHGTFRDKMKATAHANRVLAGIAYCKAKVYVARKVAVALPDGKYHLVNTKGIKFSDHELIGDLFEGESICT